MKSSELHRKIRKNGWTLSRTSGSHYLYEKNGKIFPVPYHGSKEVPKGMENKVNKMMELK